MQVMWLPPAKYHWENSHEKQQKTGDKFSDKTAQKGVITLL
jgi:hypothetical protein